MHADEVGINRLSQRVSPRTAQEPAPPEAGAGLTVAQQHGITVEYDGFVVGEYAVDPLVEETIMVEPKAVRTLDNAATT